MVPTRKLLSLLPFKAIFTKANPVFVPVACTLPDNVTLVFWEIPLFVSSKKKKPVTNRMRSVNLIGLGGKFIAGGDVFGVGIVKTINRIGLRQI